jgi:hypothetical protein
MLCSILCIWRYFIFLLLASLKYDKWHWLRMAGGEQMSRRLSFLDIGATERAVFLKFFEPTKLFTLKVHFDVRDSFVPISHEH